MEPIIQLIVDCTVMHAHIGRRDEGAGELVTQDRLDQKARFGGPYTFPGLTTSPFGMTEKSSARGFRAVISKTARSNTWFP